MEGIDVQRVAERLLPEELRRIHAQALSTALAWSHPPGLWEAIRAATVRGEAGILADRVHRDIPAGSEQVHHVAFPAGIAAVMGEYASRYASDPMPKAPPEA